MYPRDSPEAEGGRRPQPKEVLEIGCELDERGKKTGARRSTDACGLDGLERGHRYNKVDVKRGGDRGDLVVVGG